MRISRAPVSGFPLSGKFNGCYTVRHVIACSESDAACAPSPRSIGKRRRFIAETHEVAPGALSARVRRERPRNAQRGGGPLEVGGDTVDGCGGAVEACGGAVDGSRAGGTAEVSLACWVALTALVADTSTHV